MYYYYCCCWSFATAAARQTDIVHRPPAGKKPWGKRYKSFISNSKNQKKVFKRKETNYVSCGVLSSLYTNANTLYLAKKDWLGFTNVTRKFCFQSADCFFDFGGKVRCSSQYWVLNILFLVFPDAVASPPKFIRGVMATAC